MAGLVSYASSDEEDETKRSQNKSPVSKAAVAHTTEEGPGDSGKGAAKTTTSRSDGGGGPSLPQPTVPQNDTLLGPSLPPPGDEASNVSYPVPGDVSQPPGSPYTANQAMIHDLTLPSHPNLDIPPSPPGSPPRETTKKFEQFLELKKKGVHFNAKLENSDALQNPSLMDKLMGFVGIEGADQYKNTLGGVLWDPKAAPSWAHRDGLRKSNEKLAKEKNAERTNGARTSVEFVKPVTDDSR